MTEKPTPPTLRQDILRCFKEANNDSAQRMIEILDARYVRREPLPFTHDATVGALAAGASLTNGAGTPLPEAPKHMAKLSEVREGWRVRGEMLAGEAECRYAAPDDEFSVFKSAEDGGSHIVVLTRGSDGDREVEVISTEGRLPAPNHLIQDLKHWKWRDGRWWIGQTSTTVAPGRRVFIGDGSHPFSSEEARELARVIEHYEGNGGPAPLGAMADEWKKSAAEPAKAEAKPKWDRRTLEEFIARLQAGGNSRYMAAAMSGFDQATIKEIIRRFSALWTEHASDMLAEQSSDNGLLTALLTQLDEVWGMDNLVDINVEEPEHYALVLAELVAMAKRCKSYEARQPIATDQWVSGLHKPTLEACVKLLQGMSDQCRDRVVRLGKKIAVNGATDAGAQRVAVEIVALSERQIATNHTVKAVANLLQTPSERDGF